MGAFNIMPKIKFLPRVRVYRKVFPEPSPVQKSENLPDWWRKQTGYINSDRSIKNGQMHLTVKKCQAIFDSMTMGYYLKCPMDLFIDATEESLSFSLSTPELNGQVLTTHSREQLSEYPILDEYHRDILRIHPMWIIETEKGFSTLFLRPMHSDESPLYAVPGVVDTDQYPSDGYLSFFVKKGFKGIVKQGTPIVQIIPFRRDEWVSEIIDEEDSDSYIGSITAKVRTVFENGYRLKFWTKKNFK
jgi:hypothetical protein